MPTPRSLGGFCTVERAPHPANIVGRGKASPTISPRLPRSTHHTADNGRESHWQSWLQDWEERQRAELREHHQALEQQLEALRNMVMEQCGAQQGDTLQALRFELERQRGLRLAAAQQLNSVAPAAGKVVDHASKPFHTGKSAGVACHGGHHGLAHASTKTMYPRINGELAAACGVKGLSRVESMPTTTDTISSALFSDGELDGFETTGRIQALAAFMVHGHFFQMLSALLVLAYTVVIGVTSDMDMRRAVNNDGPLAWIWAVDLSFTTAFALELFLRMIAEKCWFFRGPAKFWNLFDTFVVAASFIQVLDFLDINLAFLRAIRVVRAVRVLRVIRIFHLFRPLRLMAASIISCMVSLSWAFVLLLTVMYIFSVMLLQGAGSHLHNSTEEVSMETMTVLQDDFGSMARAIFSLTLAISGGRSWGEYAAPFVEISPWYGVGFTVFVVFVIFGVLNILTGVFVASTAAVGNVDRDLVIQEEMSRQESVVNQIRTLFNDIDIDKSGTLTKKELQRNLNDSRVKAYFAVLQIDIYEATGLFDLLDVDGSGEVSVEEFIMTCMRLKGTAKSIDLAAMLFENKRMHTMIRSFMGDISSDLQRLNESLGLLLV